MAQGTPGALEIQSFSDVPLTQDFGDNFGGVLRQCFGHDWVFGERSRGISGISLHRMSLRIFLDGSGLRIKAW